MLSRIRSLHIVQAALFTVLFMAVGWRDLNPYGFSDLDAYRVGFQSQWFVFQTLNMSPLRFFLGEGLWVRFFDWLYGTVGDIDLAFTIVSVVALFLIALFIVARTRSIWYLFFLFNPALVELVLSQIRSGLACGLFWAATLLPKRAMRVVALAAAAAIHTSFILFGALFIAYDLLHERDWVKRLSRNAVVLCALLLVAALLMTVLRGSALAVLGDQRAFQVLDYTSGVMLAFAWITFAVTFVLFRSSAPVEFEATFYILASALAFWSAAFDLYGSRFSAVGMPALAVMASQLAPQYRLLFVLQFSLFSAIYFFYWLQ